MEPINLPPSSSTDPKMAAMDGQPCIAPGPGCERSAPSTSVFCILIRTFVVVWLMLLSFTECSCTKLVRVSYVKSTLALRTVDLDHDVAKVLN
jgi:hypothetical protein